MVKTRAEVPSQDKWNVESLFPQLDSWEKAFTDFIGKDYQQREIKWPELNSLKGKLSTSAEVVKQALECVFQLSRTIDQLFTYAHLRHDEDIVNNAHKAAFQRITSVAYDLQKETAWLEPELLSLSQDVWENYLNSPVLEPYKFYLEKIMRLKPHTLTVEQEELLAMSGKAMEAPHKAFSAFNNADLKFGTILNGQNEEKELSHGLYNIYIRESDRILRENAFKKMHNKYGEVENTLTELISGLVQSHIFSSKARKYKSSLEAALFPKDIPLSVYRSLIKAVREGLPSLHRYISLRKKILHLDEIHLYDMYVPLVPKVDIKMNYDEAEKLVIESVSPLGKEYQSTLSDGLINQRWVDRYENQNKRSGAYSSGCYDSYPFILMNYRGILKDTFTLAHEAGHSMHSFLSHKNQPYHYSSYPIFVAEVASTFNEELLMDLLLKRVKSPEERLYLINEKVEDIRGTLFRQTMFAEFELKIHELAEEGVPLTPQLLQEEYKKLNEVYFGSHAFIDKEIAFEWSRIPHFYYNFYVYQYATGISAALSLSEKILNGSDEEKSKAQQSYLSFLKGGGSRFPIDLLKMAGVDVTSEEPVKAALRKFDNLVSQLEQLSQ